MSVIGKVLRVAPEPIRAELVKHRELLKFLVVGGTAFIVDTALFLLLKTIILADKPVTAKIIATLVATIVSYVLNREWSFRTRGGRERTHEALLFFVISGFAVIINTAPLAVSHYLLNLQTPAVSRVTQELADFVSAQIVGTLIAMVFRFWAFKKFVFPTEGARTKVDSQH